MSTVQTNPMFNKTELPNIKLKNSCKSIVLKSVLKKQIVDHLQSIPDLNNLKNSVELVEFVANLVENSLKNNKKKKIDKRALVTEIIYTVHTLTPDEILNIGRNIDYLFENGMIKKQTMRLLLQGVMKGFGIFLGLM